MSAFRCCPHCKDDLVHEVPKDGHEVPCDAGECDPRTAALRSEVARLTARLDQVRALAEGPTSDRYRPYAVEVDGEVYLAVLLDDLCAALNGTP